MKLYQRSELANKILDLLSTKGWCATTYIRAELGLAREQHVMLRSLLNEMSRKQILRRRGSGKFQWLINVTDWDRQYPMFTPNTKDLKVEDGGVTAFNKEMDDEPEQEEEVQEEVHVSVKAYDDTELREKVAGLEKQVESLKEVVRRTSLTVEVKRYDGTSVKLKGVVLPKQFDQVKELVRCRRNVLLVGPAGCGKTHLAQLVSKALKFPRFASVSCTAGMSEAHLLGRGIPNLTTGKNKFQGTEFLTCYEEGGLFLLDELDAADPNLLLTVNSALANGYANVPNRPDNPKADQHKDFACVATANTSGRGADRMYAGRNQIDEATLDRFRIGVVECDYDEVVEAALCPDEVLRLRLTQIRKNVEAAGLRRVVSTRFMRDAYVMKKEADWTEDQVVAVLTAHWSSDEKAKAERGY